MTTQRTNHVIYAHHCLHCDLSHECEAIYTDAGQLMFTGHDVHSYTCPLLGIQYTKSDS